MIEIAIPSAIIFFIPDFRLVVENKVSLFTTYILLTLNLYLPLSLPPVGVNLFFHLYSMKLFSHSSPIFPVDDPLKTAEYYRDVLGFDINFKWEDPPTYIVINREDAVGIHLVKKQDDFKPSSIHTSLFIFVHDVDVVYTEYQTSGANITNPIG